MLELALAGILPPLLLAGLLIGLDRRRLVGLGLALGILGAQFALASFRMPPFPAVTGDEWLCWSLIACGLFALSDAAGLSVRTATLFGAVLLLVAARLLLDNLWPRWEFGEAAGNTLMVAGIAGLLWANLAGLSRHRPGPVPPGILAACAGGGAFVLAQGGSVKLGQLLGALAVGLAVFSAYAVRDRDLFLGRGACLVAALAHAGFLAAGYHFAEASLPALCLVAGAPALPWLGRAPLLRSRGPLLVGGLTLLLLAMVLALAAWIAVESAPDYGY